MSKRRAASEDTEGMPLVKKTGNIRNVPAEDISFRPIWLALEASAEDPVRIF